MAIDYSGTMYKAVEGKPCPFCGCQEIRSYTYSHSGGWTTNIECSGCLAQMPSDKLGDALERWNARASDGIVHRAVAHKKQMEWERDQAVLKLEAIKCMGSESVRTFIASHQGIYTARHADGFVYIGRDFAERWWLEWEGKSELLDCADGEKNVENAKREAHTKVDMGEECSLKLQWSKIG